MSYTDRMDKIVKELDGEFAGMFALSYPDWAFYYMGVIKAPDGAYISTDSGCSCPTPFESHSREDFTGPLTVDQVIEEYTSLVDVGGSEGLSETDRDENIVAIRDALEGTNVPE